jgi:hypothetical protein
MTPKEARSGSVLCSLVLSLVLVACCNVSPLWSQSCPGSEEATVSLKDRSLTAHRIENGVLFQAGLEIDADGAPNAYGPNNSGLDFTANAKDGDSFVGVVTDASGKPVVQKTGEFKGFYVSTTSLQAAGGDRSDPKTYVDATKIPYIVLPPQFAKQFSVALGDFAMVLNQKNGNFSSAIYADVGPRGKIGEGSVALAIALGLKSTSPRRGGVLDGIAFLVFPKSGLGPGKLRTLDEINTEGAKLFHDWGGSERIKACSQ